MAQSSKIKIGEQEFEPEELQALITKGAKVAQWEKKMPGFDVDKLMPDYTQKSQRLAKYEKGLAPKKTEQPNLEELGIDEQQVKTFEKVAKSLGFIKQSDIVENSVESQKEYFIETHPEYKPGVVGGDEKWTSLLTEFNLYNWQQHPDRVAELLERAHSEVSKGWVETARNEKVKEVITTKKAQASMAALGGSNKTSAHKAQITNTQLADKYRAMGWAEEDIKEILT